jgi:hypothetical protein
VGKEKKKKFKINYHDIRLKRNAWWIFKQQLNGINDELQDWADRLDAHVIERKDEREPHHKEIKKSLFESIGKIKSQIGTLIKTIEIMAIDPLRKMEEDELLGFYAEED